MKSLKELIGKNKIEELIDVLKKRLISKEDFNKIVLLESRYRRITKISNSNTRPNDEIQREKDSINLALINLIDDVSQDVEKSIINKTTSIKLVVETNITNNNTIGVNGLFGQVNQLVQSGLVQIKKIDKEVGIFELKITEKGQLERQQIFKVLMFEKIQNSKFDSEKNKPIKLSNTKIDFLKKYFSK